MADLTSEAKAFQGIARHCPYVAVVELIGERWSFLIIRGAMMGLRHFEEYQLSLGIARNILSDRLSKLVAAQILGRRTDTHDRRKIVYEFTERGNALLPVIAAIRQWGMDCGLHHPDGPMMTNRRTMEPVARIEVRDVGGVPLEMADVTWADRKGEEVALPFAGLPSRAAA